ncbi:MAG TPA: DUF3500 domain-containing protein [Gemmataceae bacterium]|nr:DUF3500 domain-containing protein [Gemmataceae bacterium]
MKSHKIALALLALAAVTGIAYVAQQAGSGANMVSAAEGFVSKLTADQKKQAVYDFDSDERFRWEFIPLQDSKTRKYTRKGLPLEEMTAEQKKAALDLVKAATSDSGYTAATTIMSLEGILLAQEGKKGAMVRNPGWYFFTIFGTPSKTGKWGWRVEGHHLSINFTMEGTQVVASTPCFFGANPAEVKSGPDKGKRILPQSEDYARDLFKSLDEEQKKVAFSKTPFDEPGENPKGTKGYKPRTKTPATREPYGLAAAKMTKEQKATLLKLVKSYTERLQPDVATLEWKAVQDGGFDKIHFGFSGSAEGAGKAFTYRVQGPTFVIEFLNVQADSGGNPANHIHSCWRRIKGDFGVGG